MPHGLRALVLHVLCALHDLVPCVDRALQALVPRTLRAPVPPLSCTLDFFVPILPYLLQVSHV